MKFKVKVYRTVTHTADVEIEADSEDEATKMIEDAASVETPTTELLSKADWDLDDEIFDIEEIEEA